MAIPGLESLDAALTAQDQQLAEHAQRLDDHESKIAALESTLETLGNQPAPPVEPPEDDAPELPVDPPDPDEGSVEPPVVVQPTPRDNPAQYLSYDGVTGHSQSFWNTGLKLYWKNKGSGDWMDANGEKQGAMPHAAAVVAAAGAYDFDVTPLVREWLSTGVNRGFFLKAVDTAFSFTFGGRKHSDETKRPVLRVVTDAGEFFAPPISNGYWRLHSTKVSDSAASFSVQDDQLNAIVQFDLSGVRGAVQSAVMTLHCTTFRRKGSINVFQADPPTYVDGGFFDRMDGIAASYPNDEDIADDSRVVFANDFSDPDIWGAGKKEVIVDPETGTRELRFLIPKGGFDISTMKHRMMRGVPPDTVVEERYARYYIMLEDDWRSTVDDNKMPGFDLRMGYWVEAQGGYYQQVSGNGGAPGDGRLKPYGNKMAYYGHMARGKGGKYAGDENPYRDFIWVGHYMYHIDQAGFYGDGPRWGSVILKRGRRYCIEQRMKMNSLVGPVLDEYGNREAAYDGIMQVWIDGTLCYDRRNFRWRRHPDIGIASWWMGMYHGGKNPTNIDMHGRFSDIVIATDYIGPKRPR